MPLQDSSKNKPKISVIMPFFNAEKFLDKAIQSILNQTFTEFEFIIINDASQDSSDTIVKKYLSDKRIVYIKNDKRMGIVENLNKGIIKARASIIARMDGDDISLPERFQKQYRLLQNKTDISVVGSSASIIDEFGKITGRMTFAETSEEIMREFLYRGPFLHPTILFRKHILAHTGLYSPRYPVCQDIDLFLRMLLQGYKGYNINEELLLYRKHESSTDTRRKEKAKFGLEIKRSAIKAMQRKATFRELVFIYSDFIISFLPRNIKLWTVKIVKYFISNWIRA